MTVAYKSFMDYYNYCKGTGWQPRQFIRGEHRGFEMNGRPTKVVEQMAQIACLPNNRSFAVSPCHAGGDQRGSFLSKPQGAAHHHRRRRTAQRCVGAETAIAGAVGYSRCHLRADSARAPWFQPPAPRWRRLPCRSNPSAATPARHGQNRRSVDDNHLSSDCRLHKHSHNCPMSRNRHEIRSTPSQRISLPITVMNANNRLELRVDRHGTANMDVAAILIRS